MIRWEFIAGAIFVLLCSVGKGEVSESGVPFAFDRGEESNLSAPTHKPTHKKKHHKHKRKKGKKPIDSATNTEKLLENYASEGKCNRLNCSSNIKTAKSCLKTKSLRQEHKKCFRAFCKYGCNEEDYQSDREVHDFCNLICSSKKYRKKE